MSLVIIAFVRPYSVCYHRAALSFVPFACIFFFQKKRRNVCWTARNHKTEAKEKQQGEKNNSKNLNCFMLRASVYGCVCTRMLVYVCRCCWSDMVICLFFLFLPPIPSHKQAAYKHGFVHTHTLIPIEGILHLSLALIARTHTHKQKTFNS